MAKTTTKPSVKVTVNGTHDVWVDRLRLGYRIVVGLGIVIGGLVQLGIKC